MFNQYMKWVTFKIYIGKFVNPKLIGKSKLRSNLNAVLNRILLNLWIFIKHFLNTLKSIN